VAKTRRKVFLTAIINVLFKMDVSVPTIVASRSTHLVTVDWIRTKYFAVVASIKLLNTLSFK